MKAERRGLWMAAALVALVGMGVAGCGSSDKKDQGATKNNAAVEGQKSAGPGKGRLLLYLDEAGHLASVDPNTGERREIADLLVKPGGLAVRSSGLALFQAKGKVNEDGDEEEPDGRLVIVDANDGTVTRTIALKSGGGEEGDGAGDPEDLSFVEAMRSRGVGKRFVMIPTEAGTLLVDLEKRTAIDLTATLGAAGEVAVANSFSRDERWGMITLQEKGLFLFSTEDPAKHTPIDGRSLGFSPDSKLLFVYDFKDDGSGTVWARPVDGGNPFVYADGDVEFRGSVGQSVVVAEPAALYLSNKPGDRRPLDLPYDREKDDGTYVIPIGSAGRGLIALGSKEEPRWALVDENEAKMTPLPGLDNLERAEISDDRVLFVGGFNQEAYVATTYAVLDIANGQVTPIATWDPAGAKGPFPVPSPDIRSVAITYSREGEQGSRVVILKPGEDVTELEGGLGGWAPDGSAVLLIRRVGDAAHTVLVDLATKKEKDLGPGYGGVWTVS
jgi:hypothetical protein